VEWWPAAPWRSVFFSAGFLAAGYFFAWAFVAWRNRGCIPWRLAWCGGMAAIGVVAEGMTEIGAWVPHPGFLSGFHQLLYGGNVPPS